MGVSRGVVSFLAHIDLDVKIGIDAIGQLLELPLLMRVKAVVVYMKLEVLISRWLRFLNFMMISVKPFFFMWLDPKWKQRY